LLRTVDVVKSGSFPLSNNTFRRGDDLTLLLIGVTGTEFELLEPDNTVFKNKSVDEELVDKLETLLVLVLLFTALIDTLFKGVEVVEMPLTVGLVSLCWVNILAGNISLTGVPVVVKPVHPDCC
jgi:hypothetical protein